MHGNNFAQQTPPVVVRGHLRTSPAFLSGYASLGKTEPAACCWEYRPQKSPPGFVRPSGPLCYLQIFLFTSSSCSCRRGCGHLAQVLQQKCWPWVEVDQPDRPKSAADLAGECGVGTRQIFEFAYVFEKKGSIRTVGLVTFHPGPALC